MNPSGSDPLARASRRLLLVGAIAGTVLLAGFFVDPRRAWTGWLLGFLAATCLALAGPLFLSLLRVSGARWATALTPVPLAMGRLLPWAGLAGVVLLLGVPTLYEWAHGHGHDELLARKAAWLNVPAFSARLVGCFAVWLLFERVLRRSERSPSDAGRRQKLAAAFIATFAITWSVASIDWVASLEPHWSSTIFALRTATALVLLGLASATLLVLLARHHGPVAGRVTAAHVHDLGKLLLSFSVLWVYIWFCQYMLIWYSDLPEEAVYYTRRATSGWRAASWASLLLLFFLPFLALLFERARRSPEVLVRVACVLLVGVALDLCVMVGPANSQAGQSIGWPELAGLLCGFALSFGVMVRALRRLALEPGQAACPQADAVTRIEVGHSHAH